MENRAGMENICNLLMFAIKKACRYITRFRWGSVFSPRFKKGLAMVRSNY